MKKFCLLLLILTVAESLRASEPAVWTVSTRAEIMKGDARGVSISDSGSITLAPRLTELFKTDQPYIWSSAADAAGNIYLGTGSDGKIFKVSRSGKGSLFSDLAELNVTALVAGRSSELFAATSPDGKVYRIDSAGKAEIYFDPKEKYIWSMVLMNDGSLAIGTGENGKIYRVLAANVAPSASLFTDTGETHIIALAVDKTGDLYAGTDSSAIVMKFDAGGAPFALLDSPLREIRSLTFGSDGSLYVLALGESASTPSASAPPAAVSPDAKTITTPRQNAPSPETPQKSRYDLTGAKSAVYRILPDGGVDILWSSSAVTGFSLRSRPNGGVLLGTSDKGRIYSIDNDGNESLLVQSDASQFSTLLAAGNELYATSSNQGRLYSLANETLSEGSYESAVLDAKATASWGRIWWNSSGDVQLQTRSGNTEEGDETWSKWAPVASTGRSAQIPSPKARFIQWRAILRAGSPPAMLNETSVSYLPRNIAPEVLSIQILPTNVGLVPNPPVQIDPNIELSGLEPALFGIASAQAAPRRVYQRGARSVQWTAEDRNGDRLVYDVFYKEINETVYKPLRENVAENFLTIDGQSLADGRYSLRVVAKDIKDNPAGQYGRGERVSEPFDVDNTAPVVSSAAGGTGSVVYTAADATSYITGAEYSVNGGEWQTVYADDGISDSPNERFTVRVSTAQEGEIAITLRVFDANGNSGNARYVIRK